MSGIADTMIGISKKLGITALEYLCVTKACAVRFMKVRMQGCGKCSARKKMDKANSRLGAEIYALFKQDESNWEQFPQVQQQLKLVEEAESGLLAVASVIDQINEDYEARKESIKAKYAAMREAVGRKEED